MEMTQKAIFLDRDGTINVEKDYLYKIEDFEFLPGAIEGLRLLQNAGYHLIIITNQSGIARGYYTEEDYHTLNNWMLRELKSMGISIAAVYYCPHHPEALVPKYRMTCECRKPKLGLYEKAIKDFSIDLNQSYAIGDKIRDCSICERGAHGYLIAANEKLETIKRVKSGIVHNVTYASDMLEAAKKIILKSEWEVEH